LGIKQLADSAALRGKIGVNQIYFAIAPRINAAGRLEHASKSVDLLLTEDPQAAKEMAEELNRINSKRQSLGSRIKEEVFDQLNDDLVEGSKLVFMTGQDWHPGVIGIVASQVADIYFRPTILIGINEGVGRGSARSIDGFNIYELLDSCRELFLDFGGHEGAAGFEIKLENVPELKVRLTREIENQINQETLVPRITIDSEIELSQLSLGMVSDLDRLQPFGEGNPQPVFMLRDLQLADYKTVGAEGKHLKAWFTKEGVKLETIGFGMGEMANNLNYKSSYDLAFNLDSNEYNGFESVQLSLIDIRERENP
jgi:single-stranded-DNA-specific exonuclease